MATSDYKSLPAVQIDDRTPVVVQGTVTATTTQPTRTTASISAALATDVIMNNTAELTPRTAFANIAASTTDGTLVAASGSKRIRITGVVVMTGNRATDITFNSKPSGAGTAITCLFACSANGGFVMPFSPTGWFESSGDEGISVTSSGGSTTGIQCTYIEI